MKDNLDLKDWAKRAEEDLVMAELILKRKGAIGWGAAFHCQQAIEKLLKALQIKYIGNYQKEHDLARLVFPLKQKVKLPIRELTLLSTYYVRTRYPSLKESEISKKEAEKVYKIAKKLYNKMLIKLKGKNDAS